MSLSALGLTALQQACYRTLLVEPAVDVDRMAAETGARVDEIEAALQGLRTLHLAVDAPDTPSGVAAVRPATALVELAGARARAHTRDLLAIAETHQEIQALDELVAQRASFARVPAAEPLVEILQGREAIQAFLDDLAYSSRVSVDSVVPGPRGPATRRAIDVRSAHRGQRVRWLVGTDTVLDPPLQAHIADVLRAGAQVRTTRQPVDRMVIVDREVAVVPLDPADRNAGAVVVRQPVLLHALQSVFDSHWQRAVPVEVVRGRPVFPDLADSQDARELVAALLVHPTDEAAARELAISTRQLRRRLSRTLAALGARNRIHAGALAQQLGLVDASGSGPDDPARTGRSADVPDA